MPYINTNTSELLSDLDYRIAIERAHYEIATAGDTLDHYLDTEERPSRRYLEYCRRYVAERTARVEDLLANYEHVEAITNNQPTNKKAANQ